MTVCYVTDRHVLAGAGDEQIRALWSKMESAARAGVDWIQIREKDLSGRELAGIVREVVRRIPRSCRMLVNDRLDVAMSRAANGVHLGERSLPVEEAKRFAREKNLGTDFLVGVSAHSLESAQAAEKGGADYVIFGPVFDTPSKTAFGPSQGLGQLRQVCGGVSIPVIAIGGVTALNAQECITAGASGIAAIRMFQEADDLTALVRILHGAD
jgi:thiamine-phosphate pyrophosphorylase